MPRRSSTGHSRLEGPSYQELRLLEEVCKTPEVSQRHLAHQLGVALGVANALLRSLARKGYIRTAKVGWKRWVYVVTPSGIARKVHLTVTYIDGFLGHYKRVRSLLRSELGSLSGNAESAIAVYGTTELAELVYLVIKELGFSFIDFFDRDSAGMRFLGMKVRSLESLMAADYDKVVVAFPGDPDRRQDILALGVPEGQVVSLLNAPRLAAGRSARSRADTRSGTDG